LPHPAEQANPAPYDSSAEQTSFPYSDLGNADRLVAQHADGIRYVLRHREWRYWDGCRWVRDETYHVQELAKSIARKIAEDADGQDGELARWAKRSQSRAGVGNMLSLAKSDTHIVASPEDFDRHGHLLNFENGTLDLTSGELRPHDRADFLTKLVPSPYASDADCPLFDAFLDTIFGGDRDMIGYVLRALGYTLVGGNPEQAFFILHGSGANGKSVLMNAVLDALGGDYAMQMNADSLLRHSSRTGILRSDLAYLKGVRLAVAAETGEDNHLNTSLV
jgi:putative DNA primase/helicase